MAIQEAFLFGVSAQLVRPCGVGFGTPCASRDADSAMWIRAKPAMREYLQQGSAIGILVQTRNTRKWDDATANYLFNYEEDYIVAAYGVSADHGKPWRPGRLIMEWLGLFVFGRKLGEGFEKAPGIDQIFQCSPQGCKLTKGTAMHMVNFHTGQGESRGTAIAATMQDMLKPTKQGQNVQRNTAGWLGGNFPEAQVRVSANLIGRDRLRAPSYQAPTPPSRGK
jgi:hypothetical protein